MNSHSLAAIQKALPQISKLSLIQGLKYAQNQRAKRFFVVFTENALLKKAVFSHYETA